MEPSREVVLTFKDRRFTLRPPEIEDALAIYEAVMVSMEELMPWMDWCNQDYTIEVTREWLTALPNQWKKGENYQFGIFDAKSSEFVGGCGLNHINPYYRLANLGYWVRSDRTGEGIATGASRQVARFGFSELGLRRIEIVTAVENSASRRVAEKAGALFEGILRRRIKIGDRNVDAAMHSLLPEDLQDGA